MSNTVDNRHLAEATVEARNWLDSQRNELDRLSHKRLAARIKCLGDVLLAYDSLDDAEKTHENARELAALAIYYMARGLA